MPLFRVHIDKRYGDETWTNRYFVFRDTLLEAHGDGKTIMGYERAIHATQVEFIRVRTDDNLPNSEVFIAEEVSLFGQAAHSTPDFLPLWNVAVAEFTAVMGRPSRKYLRLPIVEAANVNGSLESAYRTQLNSQYSSPMMLLPSLRDVDNQVFTGATIRPKIGMRQLKRKRKKKVII